MAGFRNIAVLGLVAALVIAPLGPLAAQQVDVTADEAIKNAKEAYGPPTPTTNCSKPKADQNDNDIVVCAKKKDDSEFRVKSTAELDPNSKEATRDGQPHAPDFAESCKKNPQGACVKIGGTPVPAYMLDFTLLPDAPEGSDADKIAKGEKKGD